MNRRGFLSRVFGTVAAATVAPLLTLLPQSLGQAAPLVAPPVFFDADAFAKMNEPGISMRFIKGFDIDAAQRVNRLDVIYGIGNLTPDFACRVQSEPGLDYLVMGYV